MNDLSVDAQTDVLKSTSFRKSFRTWYFVKVFFSNFCHVLMHKRKCPSYFCSKTFILVIKKNQIFLFFLF